MARSHVLVARLVALVSILVATATLAHAAPAHSSAPVFVKPWTPSNADSITLLVADAKVRFRQQTADTLDESSIEPFEKVGQAARRLLRRLGRDRMMLAPSIETTLDSLGLDTDVVQDPTLPSVVLVLVRNPWRLKMASVGYMLWYRGVDLRMQGVSFPAAVQPVLRSWWTGQPSSPYAAAVLYRQRGTAASQGFKYLRLAPDGYYWELAQYEGNGPDLGERGDAVFCDANHDGLPELLAYSFAPQDSILRVEGAVQPLLREVLYTERGRAFVAHDARILPGPLATLRLYLSLLRQGNREQAAKLLLQPDVLELTLAAGWAGTRSPREFVVERQEEDTAWPEWLGVRVLTRDGVTRRWNVHFMLQEGRWLIQDCIAVGEPPVDTPPSPSPAPTKGHRP